MLIEVAACAICAQPHEGPVEFLLCFEQRLRCLDVLGTMAFAALDPGVLAGQLPARILVIELRHAIRPVDQIEIAPLMLDVAHLALSVGIAAMHAAFGGNLIPDEFVALQAVAADLLAVGAMALAAVVQALQEAMRLAQLAGRELGVQLCRTKEQRSDHKENQSVGQEHRV